MKRPVYIHVTQVPCVVQNDKRQLETAMVVESRISNKNRIVSRRSLGDTPDGMEQSEVCPANVLWPCQNCNVDVKTIVC